MLSTPIYRSDAKGKVRFWQYEVEGGAWRGIGGLVDGAPVTSEWSIATAKNVGRSNETTPEEQALFEARAEEAKKLDREYRRTIAELATVPVSPMLAKDYAKLKKPLTFPVFSQPKLDGIRALITRHGATSREYQPHCNIDHINVALEPFFERFPDAVIDGELYNHDFADDFNSISSIVRTQNATDEDRARSAEFIQFHCYDTVSEHGFGKRYGHLMRHLRVPHVVMVPTARADSQEELDDLYAVYLERGYEGQIIRIDGVEYEADKRSPTLLKRKEFDTAEFLLLRIEEGNGNWRGYAKRAVFAVPADWPASGEPTKGVIADAREVGAGIKGNQAFAKKLLADREKYEGGLVTIRFFTPTPDGIPRFPVAVDFHPHGRRD